MKPLIYTKTLIALAVAIAAAAANVTQAQEQPIPPPGTEAGLPAGIAPGTPLEQVFKLVQAGVNIEVTKNYIANVRIPFNLDAAKILALSDAGVPVELINAMMAHDQNQPAAAPPTTTTAEPVPAAPAASVSETAETAPPPVPVTVNYFNDQLTPYGSWVELEGYGRCWRPTVVAYDTGWRPYCDRGHWVYTDHGWYWNSDYSWGVTFHYGRWFQHPRMGWVWWPDTVWGPSWVTWRSSDDYCGWAPLPPHTLYRPGFGLFYRGENVSVNFSFGLGADSYTFVSLGRLTERQPRYYRESHEHVTQIFQRTTIINNYNGHQQTAVNHGIPLERVSAVTHRPIQAVAVAALPNAARHGWREESAHSAVPSPSRLNPNPYPSRPAAEPFHREPAQPPVARPAPSTSTPSAPSHWPSERHDLPAIGAGERRFSGQNSAQPQPGARESTPMTTTRPQQSPGNTAAPSHWQTTAPVAAPTRNVSTTTGIPQSRPQSSPQPVQAPISTPTLQSQPRHETPAAGSGERRVSGPTGYNYQAYQTQPVVREPSPVLVPRQIPQPVAAEAASRRQTAGPSAAREYSAPAAANPRSPAVPSSQPKPAYELQPKNKDQNKDARNY